MTITYIERETGQKMEEKIYKEKALRLCYGTSPLSRLIRRCILPAIAERPLFSILYGWLQKRPSSTKKILPFIKTFEVDPSEFAEPISHFRSFNDFFIRKLKPESRPIHADPAKAVIPADGRYYFYAHIGECAGFIVKGQKFKLETLLDNAALAQRYEGGSMAIARLCPADYHRFHFPFDCLPGASQLLNGPLYSVNPLAIQQNIRILSENKRKLCQLDSPLFGPVLYLEIGATNVGSIHETYVPGEQQKKGAEKGYFEFGGSALILLFRPRSIQFDDDLLAASAEGMEIRCRLGQSMGHSLRLNRSLA